MTLKNGIAVVLVLALTGCGDDTPKQALPAISDTSESVQTNANADTSKQSSQIETPKVAETAKISAPPKSAIDVNTPNDKYVQLESGRQLAFWNYVISGKPVDYEELSTIISKDYRDERDVFKKNEIAEKLKPFVDSELNKYREGGRYFIYEDNFGLNLIESYSFDSKSFIVKKGSDINPIRNTYRYFNDANKYKYSFIWEDGKYASLSVPDIEVAKKIEALRSKYQSLTLKVYAYAESISPEDSTIIEAKVIRIELYDQKTNELLFKN